MTKQEAVVFIFHNNFKAGKLFPRLQRLPHKAEEILPFILLLYILIVGFSTNQIVVILSCL